MNCVVTAGPTYEPLDEVRRLTNFSTGRLGAELADFLTARGHCVTLLLGEQATWRNTGATARVESFSTTSDLHQKLRSLAQNPVAALFHAAAVSDFTFGKVWQRTAAGELTEVHAAKIPTRSGTLLAELLPTWKIIADLRAWYPQTQLVGWKYEMEGDRINALHLAQRQLTECRTDLCVVNGRAYGEGFGVVGSGGICEHCPTRADLFTALAGRMTAGH